MRAGTQTLIQALQAIPWAEDQDNEDDMLHPEITAGPTMEAESDDGEGTSTVMGTPLFSYATAWQFMYLT